MAITLNCSPSDSVTLNEFVEFVHSLPAPLDLDSLAEIAPHFVRLSRNRRFLSEFIVEGLKDVASFQKSNGYTGQTLMLAEAPGRFYVRANVWLPKHLLTPAFAQPLRTVLWRAPTELCDLRRIAWPAKLLSTGRRR